MAKYDSITLSSTWNGTLEVLNQSWPGLVEPSCGLNAMGGGANITFDSVEPYGPPRYHSVDPPPATQWRGRYIIFRVVASAPGLVNDTHYVCLWMDDYGYAPPASGPISLPTPNTVLEGVGGFTADFTVTLTGVYLKAQATDDVPVDRGFLWFGDRSFEEAWYIDSSAEVTVTVSGSWGSVSASGDPSFGAGELELGTNVRGTVGVGIAGVFENPDTVYARISDLSWSLAGVSLTNLDLYKPGDSGDIPDPAGAPGWSRTRSTDNCARVGNDGGIAIWAEGTYTAAAEWQGYVDAPFLVTFTPDAGKFARDETYDSILYMGPPILWNADEVPDGEISAGLTSSFGGTTWYAYHDRWTESKHVIQQDKSWEFDHEWRTLETTNIYANVDRPWRMENDEAVGSTLDNEQNDVPCPLVVYPRSATSLDGNPYSDWGGLISIGRSGELPICKPSDVVRPADWTGSGGLTPRESTGVNNDIWDITGSSAQPKATFVLPTRKWLRLDRLADHAADQLYHDPTLVILNYPNKDVLASGYADPPEDRIPEAEWHWKNYSHLELRFSTYPQDADITVVVNYSYVNVTDPWYTCFEHRFGTEGAFTYTRYQKTAGYKGTITSGVATIDLAVPESGDIWPNLYVVDSISIQFPATSLAQTWVLDDCYLCLDKTADIPDHFNVRMYDPYDYLTDYTMVSCLVDGCVAWDFPYGYEDMERTERSMKGRQKYRHCPDSEATGILDFAKSIAGLVGEINLQRGWTANDFDILNSVKNKDSEGNTVMSSLRWFDLQQCNEWSFDSSYGPDGGPVVRYYQLAAGVPHKIYHPKFPQGRFHGLAYLADRSGRLRSSGSIYLYKRLVGDTDWGLEQGPIASDAHGRFKLGPMKEEESATDTDWEYGVATVEGGPIIASSTVYNRRYWWVPVSPSVDRPVYLLIDSFGTWYRLYCTGSRVDLQRRWGEYQPWDDPHLTMRADGDADSPFIDKVGSEMILCWRDDSGYNMKLSWQDGVGVEDP